MSTIRVGRPGISGTNMISIGELGLRLAGGGGAWWAAAGVTPIAAYQPFGAASLAASYANLANPGTYNAAPGVAPTWDVATGWVFNGTSQWLNTGFVPDGNTTLLVQYANATLTSSRQVVGVQTDVTGRLYLDVTGGGTQRQWVRSSKSISRVHGGSAAAVMGISGVTAYLNGEIKGKMVDSMTAIADALAIGATYSAVAPGPGAVFFYAGRVYRVWIHNAVLTPLEMLRQSVAMDSTLTPLAGADVYIIAGQSNAVGQGTNNQSYTGSGGKLAYLLDNAYALRELTDPTDSSTGQIDTVSSDTGLGSPWPLLATQVITATGNNVVFVPCAKGGSGIGSWLPGVDHQNRATLYGSMVYRALVAATYGTLRGVLWHQGETDVISGMSQATYNGHLDTIANAVYADLGVPLIPCQLQDLSAYSTGYDESTVNASIAEAVGDNNNVVAGPNFSDITPAGDGLHLQSDAELQEAADRWFAALDAAGLV